MKCKYCGCTDERACEGGCYWIAPEICSNCKDKHFYTRQIKGLILVMQRVGGGPIVARSYIIEKLNMILNGGIGFHSLIEEQLDE